MIGNLSLLFPTYTTSSVFKFKTLEEQMWILMLCVGSFVRCNHELGLWAQYQLWACPPVSASYCKDKNKSSLK